MLDNSIQRHVPHVMSPEETLGTSCALDGDQGVGFKQAHFFKGSLPPRHSSPQGEGLGSTSETHTHVEL